MKPFQYASPRTVDSAVSLAGDQGRFLAGGIDLLGEMKDYIARPPLLVNGKDLPVTRDITPGKGSWTIGTNVTISKIEQHAELKRIFPGLQQAAAEDGSQM